MPITDEEYWRIFELLRTEVATAIKSHHTYLTHRCGGSNLHAHGNF